MNQLVEKPKKYALVERPPAASFEEERPKNAVRIIS